MASEYHATFKVTIMTPEALLYQGEVESLFITGDLGEYELLPYHYPVLGILAMGNIIINWREAVPVKFGILRFFANDCVILVEEIERLKVKKGKKEEVVVEEEEAVHHV